MSYPPPQPYGNQPPQWGPAPRPDYYAGQPQQPRPDYYAGQPQQYVQYAGSTAPVIPLSARFEFDGGAGTYLGTGILAFLITVLTLGLGIPWAICVRYRWRTKHTLIDGYRLRFTGGGAGLFGNWIKWWFFIIITIGIYSFWVVPRLTRWITRHQEFDLTARRAF